MWRMVLPGWMARVGSAFERRGAPPLYRGTRIVTLSNSSKEEIVDLLRLDPDHISVVPPGVEPQFSPGGQRSATPLVVAVGRLVPVKRFELLVESLVKARTQVPGLRAVIIGEGYERPMLEELRHAMGADDWLDLPGRVTDQELVGWYQKAWVVASSSLREGWGMTLTEAGACGTPAVATDIAGHRDAVVDGQSGLLAGTNDALAASLVRVLSDEELRARLSAGAAARAARLTWDATARATLELLAAEAARQR
jgi:glycosyltransferase involved in cell wall biosynthesis